MFFIKDHLAYSENCFDRTEHPENRDLCISADFDSLPARFAKGAVRVVMDGMTNANGKEAVENAAPALYGNLIGGLMGISRDLSEEVERAGIEGEEAIRDYLEPRIRSLMLNSLRTANSLLRFAPEGCQYCTVSVAIIFHRWLFTCNMGDSPIYLLDTTDEEAALEPLFHLDNEAGELIDSGLMTEAESLTSDKKNGLLRFLGYERRDLLADGAAGTINFHMVRLPQSSLLLLGSDGALSQLLRSEMTGIIRDNLYRGLPAVLDALRSAVELTGSEDDFTLLLDLIKTD